MKLSHLHFPVTQRKGFAACNVLQCSHMDKIPLFSLQSFHISHCTPQYLQIPPFIDVGNPRSQPWQHPAALHLLGPTWCVLMECRSATVQSTSGSGDPEPLQVMTAFSPSLTVRFTWLTLISGRSGRADIEILRCRAALATGHTWIKIPPSCLSN